MLSGDDGAVLTGSVRDNIPDATVALLVANEYGQDDYIKFSLLKEPGPGS